MRVAFLGTPEFAVPALEALLRSRHEIVVVITRPDRPRGRGQRVQASPVAGASARVGLRVLQPARVNAPEVAEELRSLAIDALVVVAFGAILRDALLAAPRVAALNVHPSLLPDLRGPAPVERAVWEGRSWTGVTIQHVAREVDAGDIALQRAVPIGADETAGEVLARLAPIGAEMLVHALDDLADGRAARIAQDHARATYAPVFTREHGAIDWSRDVFEVAARIRGVTPAPGARATIGQREVIVHRARPVDRITGGGDAGVVTGVTATDGIIVQVAGGHIGLLEVQAVGRRVLPGDVFARGARVAIGERCGGAIVPFAESEVRS